MESNHEPDNLFRTKKEIAYVDLHARVVEYAESYLDVLVDQDSKERCRLVLVLVVLYCIR